MRRLVPGLVITVAVASALLSLLTLEAAPAAADTVTVTPSTGLPASGQLVQVSGTVSGGAIFFVVAAHRGAQTYCNTTAYFPAAPAGAPYTLTIAVGAVLRHIGAMAAGDPCADPTMPGEPLCETGGPNSCAIELRRAGTGEVLASTPIVFDFPPPVCSDFTTPGRSVLVSARSRCSDPYKRNFAIEILDGPHHGTLGPPDANDGRKYTAAFRYIGSDQFTFQAVVGDQRSNVATMHLNAPGPDFSGKRNRYFRAFVCGRGGRRSFDFGFRPAGGSGRLTPPSFTSAKYLFPFSSLFADADAARPHLSISSATRGSRTWTRMRLRRPAMARAARVRSVRSRCAHASPVL